MKSEREILAKYGRRERGTTTKTVQEISAEHGKRAGELLTSVYDRLDDIRDGEELEHSSYLHRLSEEQRRQALQEQKVEKAEEHRREIIDAYKREVESYHARLARRQEELEEALFGGLDSQTLAAAASAADDALPRILQAAIAAGDGELIKACFVAGESRGLAEVTARCLEAAPEAQDLYQELKSIPSEEARERQLETVERVVPEVESERLMGSPPVGP